MKSFILGALTLLLGCGTAAAGGSYLEVSYPPSDLTR
jgi:hypothetical protein